MNLRAALAPAMMILCLIDHSVAQSTTKTPPAEEVIFDGSSLDNFRGYKYEKIGRGWKVDDGTLMFDGSGGGDIITKKSYGNFELSFEWKVDQGSNSGVMYRVTKGDSAPYLSGPEFQILDDAVHKDGKNPLTSAGSLYGLYKPQNKKLNPVGQWNTAKIVHEGNKVEHWLNGEKVVSAEIGGSDWTDRVSASKFKGWKKFGVSPRGHICFQDHGDPVWYRNIRIKTKD